MRWKESLTPLDAVPSLGQRSRQRLALHSITSAEELVGQIEAEPAAVAELLELDDVGVRELGVRAASVAAADFRRSMEVQRARSRSLGALPPLDEPAGPPQR